ncbi:InlB B-repeat-containing protein, partial [Ruminococcaceae bacterium OttesenSCG-928-O06]|nr:InlB B-repeat-containing protein [Ruminococcaceae bacterium OttesenSCG-928-O06]
TGGAVTDTMPSGVGVSGSTPEGITVEGDKLAWTPDLDEPNTNGYASDSATYRVTLDIENDAITVDGWNNLNANATFSYTVGDNSFTKEFPIPQGYAQAAKVFADGYLVNSAGEFLNTSTYEVTTNPAEALIKTATGLPLNNSNGVNQWNFRTVESSEITAPTVTGYTLKEIATESVTLTLANASGTFDILYVLNNDPGNYYNITFTVVNGTFDANTYTGATSATTTTRVYKVKKGEALPTGLPNQEATLGTNITADADHTKVGVTAWTNPNPNEYVFTCLPTNANVTVEYYLGGLNPTNLPSEDNFLGEVTLPRYAIGTPLADIKVNLEANTAELVESFGNKWPATGFSTTGVIGIQYSLTTVTAGDENIIRVGFPRLVTVSYNGNGGNVGSAKDFAVPMGSEVMLDNKPTTTPTREPSDTEYYTFAGWSMLEHDDNWHPNYTAWRVTGFERLNKDMTVYAVWIPTDRVNFTFEMKVAGEGTVSSPNTRSGPKNSAFNSNEKPTVAPANGYQFVIWQERTGTEGNYTYTDVTTWPTTFDKSRTFVAVMEKIPGQWHTITFTTDGNGTIDGAEDPIVHGDLLTSTEFPARPETVADFGYVFDGWYDGNTKVENFPASVSESKRYEARFVPDEKQVLPYIVKYYYNDVHDDTLDYSSSVQVLTPQVSSVPLQPKTGYKLSDTPYEPALPTTITAEDNVIKVYYVTDDSIRLPYTVKYYYNDVHDDTLDYSSSVQVLTPQVSSVPLQPKAGYKLSDTPYVPELPTT